MINEENRKRRLTLVFLYVISVTPNIIKKNCIFELSELGYKSVVIDVSKLFAPQYDNAVKEERINESSFPAIKYFKPRSISEFERYILKYRKDSFFFPMFHNYYEVRQVYHFLIKYDLRYGLVDALQPNIDLGKKRRSYLRLKDRLTVQHVKKALYNRLYNRLIKYVRGLKRAEFIGCASNYLPLKSLLKLYPCDSYTKVLRLHSYDYETYLSETKTCPKKTNYCVFLDQYLPYHPDNTISNMLRIDASKYYEEINAFLKRINEITGYDIIVAAHPKADYINRKVYDKDFEIYRGNTASLVNYADLVVAHFSTAIDYAVMAKKPIVIIKNQELCMVNRWAEECDCYADLLNLKAIENLNDIDENILNESVDEQRYDDFLQKYVFCEERKTPCLWKMIIENIETI